MARAIATIRQQMIDYAIANYAQSGQPLRLIWFDTNGNPRTPSQTNIVILIFDICAVGIGIFEQQLDFFKLALESFAATIAPGTPSWYQNQVFLFQYDASNPQVVQLVNFVPTYPIVNSSLRIISRCSVKTDSNKVVQIKVATGGNPVQLSSPQQTALVAYLDTIAFAGTEINVMNLASDKLYCSATIYYNGQYTTTIQANVIGAMNKYLASIPFDGTIKISSLEDAIQAVLGVTDVTFDNVVARLDTSTILGGFPMVVGGVTVNRLYPTGAGYIIQETTSGFDFASSLTFLVSN